MHSKKGQAAMEFLMTYGWAILAAIIAIGVLAYFGVFSPGRFVQDSYFIGAPFGANAGKVNVTGITLDIQNGAGETVTIMNVTMSGIAGCSGLANNFTVVAGSSKVVTILCDPVLIEGATVRGNINVNYLRQSIVELSSTGTITARVKAA
ncbi:MAG: hypothetical protein AABX12_04450 [Nanoarchaeota archaeon]